ncbi:insulin receptor-like isoform X3 [Stegodyphus dumicola]|uniref:insulin receptor-like isoform X3 n=1 Tax=Stegodyphus dumicola TaxID=202533 RepID=UPI0015AFAC6C|nr:insulin receptor-like isoform X3 [Stegodyphus dumicola]
MFEFRQKMSLVHLLLIICPICYATPYCCQQPYEYTDFFAMLECNLFICRYRKEDPGSKCCEGSGKKMSKNNTDTYENIFQITKPHLICQTLERRQRTVTGHIVLAWSVLKVTETSPIFAVESRHTNDDNWHLIGMANETVAEIRNLTLGEKYQFQVTPLMFSDFILQPVKSEWFTIPAIGSTISAPVNVHISRFSLVDKRVNAFVEWKPSKELPCVYRLHLLPSNNHEDYDKKTIYLPKDNLTADLVSLLFETNYTLVVTGLEMSGMRGAAKNERWFATPSCLKLTEGNFSLCAPGFPRNFTADWYPITSEAVLRWLPPKYTSEKNPWHLNTTISGLKYNSHYVFELKAVSIGGSGKATVVKMITRKLKSKNISHWTDILKYIIPLVLFLLLTIAGCFYFLNRRKLLVKEKFVAKRSGTADVPAHLLPFLLPLNKIELLEPLGEGAFGIVHKGIFHKGKDEEPVAVKTFRSDSITRHQLLEEVAILQDIGRHNRIIKLIGFTLDIDRMYLLLELCPLGDLRTWLLNVYEKVKYEIDRCTKFPVTDRPRQYPSEQTRNYGKKLGIFIYQVAEGMEYLSSLKMIHRDIAARNILLETENSVKISDFGLSKDAYTTKNYISCSNQRLPIRWMAPEAIERKKFSTFTDVWSFGVYMWEVLSLGKEPYRGRTNTEILPYLKAGKRLRKPKGCSPEWYVIMRDCWHSVPESRPQFRNLLKRIRSIIEKDSNYLCFS